MFRFLKRNKTQTKEDYTDQAINRLEQDALGGAVRPDMLASIQFAGSLVGRSFQLAEIKDPESLGELFTPNLLAMVGRQLVIKGEAVIIPESGEWKIISDWDIRGTETDPQSWSYRCWSNTPSGQYVVHKQGWDLLHFRVNVDPLQPWKGQPLWKLGNLTSEATARMEKAVIEISQIPAFAVYPVPNDKLTPSQFQEIMDSIMKALRNGSHLLVQGGQGNQLGSRPVAPDPSPGFNSLRKELNRDLLISMGIPESLWTGAEGSGLREAYRQLGTSLLEPLAMVVQGEIFGKLDIEPDISFERLMATDLSRGRALKQFVDSGVPLKQALELVGLSND